MPPTKLQISVLIESDLLEQVDDLSHDERRSRANMVGQLVREALERRAELGAIITRGNQS